MGAGSSFPTRQLEANTYVNVYIERPRRCIRYRTRCQEREEGYRDCREECDEYETIYGQYKIKGKHITSSGKEGEEVNLPWTTSTVISYHINDARHIFRDIKVKRDPVAGNDYALVYLEGGQVIRLELTDVGGGGNTSEYSYDRSRDVILDHCREAGLRVPRVNTGTGETTGGSGPSDQQIQQGIRQWLQSKRNQRNGYMRDPVTQQQIKVGGKVYRETEQLISDYVAHQ